MTGRLAIKKTQKGVQYYYIVLNTKPTPKWISTGLKVENNKRKAEEILKEEIKKYDMLEFSEITESKMLFTEYLNHWVKNCDVRETTRKEYKSALNTHIIPFFEETKLLLSDIKTSHLRPYYNFISQKLAKKTVRNHQGILSKALKDAYFDELILNNPHDRIKLIKPEKKTIETLTTEEYQQLLKHLEEKDEELHLIILLFCELAIRRGELLGLEWKNINLDTGEIKICATRNKVSKHNVEYQTKNQSSNRSMFVSEKTLILLKKEKAKQEEYKELFGSQYIFNDLVIKYPNGHPYSDTSITNKVGTLTNKLFNKRITPHKLRHTVASVMIDNGVPLYNVSKYLGHSSVQTTEAVYIHEKEDFNKDTLLLFQDKLSN
ncbi:MAG: site-specific integrase [Clostridia bacterium]|nr:site-specific integrase [Clostridia bacterium]